MNSNTDYIPMKDIKGNEDLHEIARNIDFEDGGFMPKTITRKQFVAEIKSQIEWYFDMVSPPVSKDILNKEYMKILKIEEMERRKNKNMKNYEKTIDKNNITQNVFGLNILLQTGKTNLLNDEFYNRMLDNADKNTEPLMTGDYLRGAIKIARKMAELNDKDFCEYIYDKVKADKRFERGR